MMKKVLATVLAASMIFSSAAVFAADSTAESTDAAATGEEASLEINWKDLEAMEGAQDIISLGDFVTFEDLAVKMWVPSIMEAQELTDDDKDAGFIGYFSTEDQSGIASVVYVNAEGITSVDDYAAVIKDIEGVSDVELGTVNGFPAVSYEMPEQDTASIAFATEAGNLLEFTFYPASDESFQAVCAFMTGSIQNAEEDTAAESTAASTAESAA